MAAGGWDNVIAPPRPPIGVTGMAAGVTTEWTLEPPALVDGGRRWPAVLGADPVSEPVDDVDRSFTPKNE